jgi:outer membrane receptor protein involved in Fe transport
VSPEDASRRRPRPSFGAWPTDALEALRRVAAFCLFVAVALASGPTAAQQSETGTISGRVFDGETGAPLSNATIILAFLDPGDGSEPRQEVATSGPAGDYEFGAVPAGLYTVSFIKSGYRASSIKDFQVLAGQDNVADFPMPPRPKAASDDVLELDAFVVEASVVGEMMDTLDLRLESDQMLNLLSAEDLAKFAATDVADALKRVAGVNIVDGQFAIIRGLEDRYSSTLYNGAPVPSPDPESQSVQLDLFPSEILSTLQVAKNFDASSPSNSSGGSIDIVTHDYPDEITFKFSAGSGFNENPLGRFIRYQADSPIGVDVGGSNTVESDFTGSLGGRFEVLDREIRFKIVASQEIDFDTAEGMQESREPQVSTGSGFRIRQTGGLALGELDITEGRFDLATSRRREQDTYFLGLGIDLDREGHHRLDGSIFYTKKQDEIVQTRENGVLPGFDYSAVAVDDFLRPPRFLQTQGPLSNVSFLRRFREEEGVVNRGPLSFAPRFESTSIDRVRELEIYQLNGAHELDALVDGLSLSWVASYSETSQTETGIRARFWFEPFAVPEPLTADFIPDQFPPRISDFGPGRFVGGTADTTPFFSNDIDENQYFGRVDLAYQRELSRHVAIDLQAGYWFEQGNRKVEAATDTTENVVAGRPGVVGSGSTGFVEGATQDELGRNLFRGLGLDDPQNRANSSFKREIRAWSFQGKLTLWDDLDLIGGVRLEDIRIISQNSPFIGRCANKGANVEASPGGFCPEDFIPLIFPGRFLLADRLDNPDNPFFGETAPSDPNFVFNDQILGIDLPVDENGFVDVTSRDDILRVVNGEIDEFKVLPAVAVAYRPIEGLSLRGAYSQTVARPSFRELGYYVTLGTGSADFTIGNPQLLLSEVESFDLRLEYVWGDFGDLVGFSFFTKTIDDPIESIAIRDPTNVDNLFRTFRNNENQAEMLGIELEARKNLGFMGDFFEYFSIGGNFTWIDAEVERSQFEIDQAAPFFRATQADIDAGRVRFDSLNKKRRLFNQPEWIGNADVSFDHTEWGTKVTLSIFALSEVLDAAGSGNILPNGTLNSFTLDRFVDTFHQIDLVMSQSFEIPLIPGEWTVKTSIKNVTDTTRKIIFDQEQTNDDIRERSFKIGRDYSFSIGYQFVF